MAGTSHLSPAELFCHSINAVIVFSDCFNITITNLVLKNCGGTGPTLMPSYDINRAGFHEYNIYLPLAGAVFLNTCYYCNIRNVTFIGYGIIKQLASSILL